MSLSSSPRVALLHLLVGKDEQDLGKKSRGGRCPRGLIEGVFLTNTGTCSPRACVKSPFSCVVKMHVSGVSSWSVILECHPGDTPIGFDPIGKSMGGTPPIENLWGVPPHRNSSSKSSTKMSKRVRGVGPGGSRIPECKRTRGFFFN